MLLIIICLNNNVFVVSWVYIALSRAQKLKDVWLIYLDLKAFKTNCSIITKYKNIYVYLKVIYEIIFIR
jgi:hypothetical protein